jgi:hypothetical protein
VTLVPLVFPVRPVHTEQNIFTEDGGRHRITGLRNLYNLQFTSDIIVMALQAFVGPWPLFLSFLTLYTVDRTP